MKSVHDKALVWAVRDGAGVPMPERVVAQTTATQPRTTPGTASAPTRQRRSCARKELEQLLAPDRALSGCALAQVLMASTYPLEIVQAARAG
jgi:hypothetical protein